MFSGIPTSSRASQFTCLEQSNYSVFFAKPTSVNINEEGRTDYASSQKVETLIQELKEKGPLVGLGQMGPGAYVEESFKLSSKMHGLDLYGWKPEAARVDHPKDSYFVVLGAKKQENSAHVFFTLSQDVTDDASSYCRTHQPLRDNPKVYIVSHKTFCKYLQDLYPPIPNRSQPSDAPLLFGISSHPQTIPSLSTVEREYVEKLSSIEPLASILDRGVGTSACKAIGQEIFDRFKAESGGNSLMAKHAVQKICNAILSTAHDGSLRKQYIEQAWRGIGDDTWRWMP